VTGVF